MRSPQPTELPVLGEENCCGICGDPVDKSLAGTHKMGPTVDHIVPLVAGGSYWERTNLRLAHFSCNAKAGNAWRKDELERHAERVQLLRAALWLRDRAVF